MWTDYGAFESAVGSGVFVSLKVMESKKTDFLDLSDRFVSLTFEDEDTKADKFTLVIDNRDLLLSDDARISKGQKWEASWGYHGMMTAPRELLVRSVKGFSVLTVTGLAKSVTMDKEPVKKTWKDITDSDIALEVGRKHGFDPAMIHVDETKTVHEHIHQMESDARFLTRRANRNGFVFFVDHTGLHFHRRRLGTPPIRSYAWGFETSNNMPGGDIIGEPSFESLHTRRKPGLVKMVGRDDKTGESFEVQASNEDTDRDSLGESQEVANPDTVTSGSAHENLANMSVFYTSAKTEQEAKEEADSYYFRRSTDRAKLSFTAVGDPRVRAKEVVVFWCRSLYMSGPYYVEKVKTTVGPDFVQELHLIRDAAKRVPLEIPLPDIPLSMSQVEEGEEESHRNLQDQGQTERVETSANVNDGTVRDMSEPTIQTTAEEQPDGTWSEAYEYHNETPTFGSGSIKYDQKMGITVKKNPLVGSSISF